MSVIAVGGTAPYDIVIGHGVLPSVSSMVEGADRVLVVADERVAAIAAGLDADVHVIASGEKAKTIETLSALWDEFALRRLTRSDAIVAVGGGATTDVVGLAAATWLRGVRVVHVPTTLLGMVDAAIGGKTGVNTAAGKNLVGAFHPPAGVVVELDVLDELPVAEWINGMAEVVKAGFIADPQILTLVDADPTVANATALIERSVQVKADVVGQDLREHGLREILNYGHTLGHAIERAEDYAMPHGHAVSIGMVFAAGLARAAGRLDDDTADRHREVLDAVGLPTTYRRRGLDELLEVMRVDKKARGDTLRFVVLDGLAKPSILAAPDESLLRAAFAEVTR